MSRNDWWNLCYLNLWHLRLCSLCFHGVILLRSKGVAKTSRKKSSEYLWVWQRILNGHKLFMMIPSTVKEIISFGFFFVFWKKYSKVNFFFFYRSWGFLTTFRIVVERTFLIWTLFFNPYNPTHGKCCSPLHLTSSLKEAVGSYPCPKYRLHRDLNSDFWIQSPEC